MSLFTGGMFQIGVGEVLHNSPVLCCPVQTCLKHVAATRILNKHLQFYLFIYFFTKFTKNNEADKINIKCICTLFIWVYVLESVL